MLSMETEELREQIEDSENNIMELTHNSGQQRKSRSCAENWINEIKDVLQLKWQTSKTVTEKLTDMEDKKYPTYGCLIP